MNKASSRNAKSKKPAAPVVSAEDDSYIVFGDGKPKKNNKAPEPESSTGKNGTGTAEATGETAVNKPDTRKLIGGASWTGKLPVNMLSEHCQKQKWAKPEYTVVRYVSNAVLVACV